MNNELQGTQLFFKTKQFLIFFECRLGECDGLLSRAPLWVGHRPGSWMGGLVPA